MDFGKVEPTEINKVDFNLPEDGKETLKTFENPGRTVSPKTRIGLDKWGRKEWVGAFYPRKTKERDFLNEYSKRLNTIECNAAFYSIPTSELIEKWNNMVAEENKKDFLFIPKVSRIISHINRLYSVEEPMALFLESMKSFGQHLGPIFLQLGDNFGPKKISDVENFVKQLPTDQRFFIELRHEEWFSNSIHRKLIFNLFRKYNIGSVITDSAGRRDCVHMELTIPETYIRFNGIGEEFKEIDRRRIDDWADRLSIWLSSGLEKIYFIISQHDQRDSPELAQYAIEQFNSKLGADIPLIKWDGNATESNDSDGIVVKISAEELEDWKAFLDSKKTKS